jgi:hypothetical protein
MSNQRKTIEQVKQYFEDYGCRLLESDYVNAHKKMRYICVCGNESSINLNNFQNGKRCGCGRIGVKRLTPEEVRVEVEARGFEFVSEHFTGTRHVVRCMCVCGNERNVDLRTLRRSKCKECRNRSFALKLDEVKQYFVDQGCELLEPEYKNAHTKMKYRCVCGNESDIVYDSFKRGNRCKACGVSKISDKVAGDKHPNWNPNREQVASNLRFRKLCCSMVKNVLRTIGKRKFSKTAEILGYDYKQLREHLRSHPNWLLIKDEKWQVDHIFPIKAFLDYGVSDMRVINCLDNLQPLPAKQNLSKHDNYDPAAFEFWLRSKDIEVKQ